MPPPAAAARQSGQSSPPSPAAAAAATGASVRLPGPSSVLFTRWPRRFLESPCQRREVFARRLRIRRFQLFGNWGCCGGGGAHFSVVLLCGVGFFFFFFFFARSSQERAVPRAQEGARQSRRVRRAAGLAAVAGERAGKKRRPSGRERRAERVLFLDAPAPAPAPRARSPGSSRSAGPGIPHAPDRPPSCCCLSPAGWQELQMQAGEGIQPRGSTTWVRLL